MSDTRIAADERCEDDKTFMRITVTALICVAIGFIRWGYPLVNPASAEEVCAHFVELLEQEDPVHAANWDCEPFKLQEEGLDIWPKLAKCYMNAESAEEAANCGPRAANNEL